MDFIVHLGGKEAVVRGYSVKDGEDRGSVAVCAALDLLPRRNGRL